MMRAIRHTCIVAAFAFTFGYAVHAQSFDLKTGQWEFTITGLSLDTSQLSPQMRAALEAGAKKPSSYKGCVTAENLRDLNLGKMDDGDETCKVTSKKISGSAADLTRECTGDDKSTQTIHYEAISRESLRGTMKSVSDLGPVAVTISGKWIGPTCKED
jgi:Protein of unknown function (DUF3617)